ncbi:MAG: class I SAM-dependent methyltransferase, partial [Candidatus Omnitrophota bacterium]
GQDIYAYSSEFVDRHFGLTYVSRREAGVLPAAELGVFGLENNQLMLGASVSEEHFPAILSGITELLVHFYDIEGRRMIDDVRIRDGDITVDRAAMALQGPHARIDSVENLNMKLNAWRKTRHEVDPVDFIEYLFSLRYFDKDRSQIITERGYDEHIASGVLFGLITGLTEKYGSEEKGFAEARRWIALYFDKVRDAGVPRDPVFTPEIVEEFFGLVEAMRARNPSAPRASGEETNPEQFAQDGGRRAAEIYREVDSEFVEQVEGAGYDFEEIFGMFLNRMLYTRDLDWVLAELKKSYPRIILPQNGGKFATLLAFADQALLPSPALSNPLAVEFVERLGESLAIRKVSSVEKQGLFSNVLPGNVNPDPGANDKPYVDLAAGTNPVIYLKTLSTGRRYIFIDHSPFVVAFLNKAKEMLGADQLEVRQQDIFDIDFEDGSIGTLRLRGNIGKYLEEIPSELYDKIERWMAPGGEVIIQYPTEAGELNRPIIDALCERLKVRTENGWKMVQGHFRLDGTFKEFTFFLERSEDISLYDPNTAAFVFTKPLTATSPEGTPDGAGRTITPDSFAKDGGRRYPAPDNPNALRVVRAALAARAERGWSNYPKDLQRGEPERESKERKGKHKDVPLYQAAFALERKLGITLLPRHKVKRGFDTLEGWRRFITGRIVAGEDFTVTGIEKERSGQEMKMLYEIEKENNVQLALRWKTYQAGFGKFAAKAAKAIWTKFNPEKTPTQKDAKEIAKILRERPWQERLILLSLFYGHDLLKERTEAFLATTAGEELVASFEEPILSKTLHIMIVYNSRNFKVQATNRVLAWLTLVPEGAQMIRERAERSEALRSLWPQFLESEFGGKLSPALEEAEKLAIQTEKGAGLQLEPDEEQLYRFLRHQREPVSLRHIAEQVYFSGGYVNIGTVSRFVTTLKQKGVRISSTPEGSIYLENNGKIARHGAEAKDGGMRQVPTPLLPEIRPSVESILTTSP